jgi:micrococcal nuclease
VHRFAILLLAIALASCSRGSTAAEPPGAGTVVRPVDGDTLVVHVGGADEPVRLIGIDTPESVAQDRPVECFGPEAKDQLAALLPAGTAVLLERDAEARDRYDRLLAYVIRADDGLFVNGALVEDGFAEAASYPPNTARQGELDAAEARARAGQRGLWPACGSTDVPLGR